MYAQIKQYQNVQAQNNDLQAQVKEQQAKNKQLLTTNKDLEVTLAETETENRELQSTISGLESNSSALEAQLAELQELQKRQYADAESAKIKIENLEQDLEKAAEKRAELELKLQEPIPAIEALRAELASVQELSDRLAADLEASREELEDRNKDVIDGRNEVAVQPQ